MFYTVLYVTAFFFVVVVALMLSFIVLYRRRKGPLPAPGPTHNTPLEIVWTGIPLAVVTVLFVMGLRAFLDFDTPPSDAEVIDVEARQWAFSFTYPNGAVSEKLYLEVDRPVIFSFIRPTCCTPSTSRPSGCSGTPCRAGPTEMWFQPDAAGHVPRLLHAVLRQRPLADDHRGRWCWTRPATPPSWPSWPTSSSIRPRRSRCRWPRWAGGSTRAAAARSATRWTARPAQGPTWLGLYKSDVQFSVPARTTRSRPATSDAKWDAYLRESILDPGAKIVLGLPERDAPLRRPVQRHAPTRTRSSRPSSNTSRASDNHGPGGKPKYYRADANRQPEVAGKSRNRDLQVDNSQWQCQPPS